MSASLTSVQRLSYHKYTKERFPLSQLHTRMPLMCGCSCTSFTHKDSWTFQPWPYMRAPTSVKLSTTSSAPKAKTSWKFTVSYFPESRIWASSSFKLLLYSLFEFFSPPVSACIQSHCSCHFIPNSVICPSHLFCPRHGLQLLVI